MWTVKCIRESDYGCEERSIGEIDMVIVYLESDDGRECQFEVADSFLRMQDINEGDEWPEDLEDSRFEDTVKKQQDFMENYYDAIEEYEET